MKLVNNTPFACSLYRSTLRDPEHKFNSMLTRIRHQIDGHTLRPVSETNQPKSLRSEPVELPYAILPTEQFYPRTGTDLVVLADALPSQRAAVEVLEVRLEAGPYEKTLRVFGDRQWQSRFGDLQPSYPQAFHRMPLCWSRSFGGVASGEYGAVVYPNNPVGRGFYLSKDQAVGGWLPNIEDPTALLQRWDERPDPVGFGFYPNNWGLRLSQIASMNPSGQVRLQPQAGIFDCAHPRLSGRSLTAGTQIRLWGVGSHDDEIARVCAFVLPSCPVVLEVRIGPAIHVREPVLEEVLIDLHAGHVDLSYRKMFDYHFIARQLRTATLRMMNGV